MGRSIGGKEGYSRTRISSTPEERKETIVQKCIVPLETKVGFVVDAPGKHWKVGKEYDVLNIDERGRLVVGYSKTNYRVGSVSPNHHGLVVKNK